MCPRGGENDQKRAKIKMEFGTFGGVQVGPERGWGYCARKVSVTEVGWGRCQRSQKEGHQELDVSVPHNIYSAAPQRPVRLLLPAQGYT